MDGSHGAQTTRFIVCADCQQYRTHAARGLCQRCYGVRRHNGTLNERPPVGRQRRTCIECTQPAVGRDRCINHYNAHRRRRVGYGTWELEKQVEPAAAATHLRALRATGMPLRMIGAAAQLSPRTVDGLLADTIDALAASTADRILDVPIPACWPLEAPDSTLVDPTGTVRRLQGLTAIGWSCAQLAARLGTSPPALQPVIGGRVTKVKAQRARAVRDLYDQLSMTSGSSGRSATAARKNGWVHPLAWDDDTIDDPAAMPADTGTATSTEERIDDYDFLVSIGVDPDTASDRAGVSQTTIKRWKSTADAA